MEQSRRIRVLTVEHHSALQHGLCALLGNQEDIELAPIASTAEQAIEYYAAARPDLALVDVDMPGGSGLDVIRRIRRREPAAWIIALVTYEWDQRATAALESGACSFVPKDQIAWRLLPLIRLGPPS